MANVAVLRLSSVVPVDRSVESELLFELAMEEDPVQGFDFTTGVTTPDECAPYIVDDGVLLCNALKELVCLIIVAAALPATRGGVYIAEELISDKDNPCPSGLCGMMDN